MAEQSVIWCIPHIRPADRVDEGCVYGKQKFMYWGIEMDLSLDCRMVNAQVSWSDEAPRMKTEAT